MSVTPPTSAKKVLTNLDHRIEAAAGHSIDQLWEHRDRDLLDEPRAQLVDAHRRLVRAVTDTTFYRVLLARLSSGEFSVDEALFARIARTVDQLKEAAAERDRREAEVVSALEPLETLDRAHAPADAGELSAPDFAALLAIAQDAKLHEHLLTQRLSVVTASGARITHSQLLRLEDAGLVVRDTAHPLHAGQPVTLTDAGRAALTGPRGTSTAAAPAQRSGTWPAPARPRR